MHTFPEQIRVTPISATAEILIPIWQRVLQRSSICAQENFFDIGGDDSLTDALFAEIALAFGRRLPRATIVYAPTIAALAALLEEPVLPAFSPFVLMKPGDETPPIFMAHGLSGNTTELVGLVSRIQTKHPIYGIQPLLRLIKFARDSDQNLSDSSEELAKAIFASSLDHWAD